MAQFWKTVSKNTVFMNKAAGVIPPSFWRNAYGNKISDDFLSGGGYRKRDSEKRAGVDKVSDYRCKAFINIRSMNRYLFCTTTGCNSLCVP